MKPIRKLRNYLISPKDQVHLSLYFILFFAVNSGLAYIFVFFLAGWNIGNLGEESGILVEGMDHFVSKILHPVVIPFTILGLLTSFFTGFIAAHRFLGPSYKFKKFFQNLDGSEKEVPRIGVRKGDFLGDLAEEINSYFERKQENSSKS